MSLIAVMATRVVIRRLQILMGTRVGLPLTESLRGNSISPRKRLKFSPLMSKLTFSGNDFVWLGRKCETTIKKRWSKLSWKSAIA
jgi:hypothetical protein